MPNPPTVQGNSSARWVITVVVMATLLAVIGSARADTARSEITVDAASVVGVSNQRLAGFGWNMGTIDGVRPLLPPTVRIDADLASVSPALGVVHLDSLVQRVATVRSTGAEPIVILSYMPVWLGSPRAYGRDPQRVAPADLDQWEALIEQVVRGLVTAAPAGRYRFEVWNEPDLPIFWQDLPTAFIDLAVRTHRAVGSVAADFAGTPGLQIEVGGPAAFFADPLFISAYVDAVTRAGLPLDFVSWHHYGNTPFLGPDGAEDILPTYVLPVYPVLGQRNPATSPVAYGAQVTAMRALIDGLLATRPAYDPELIIDEWNLSAGGYDVRHDTNEGAAFAAGTLMEMEAAGLDAADFYRAAGGHRVGDWGITRPDGTVKPTWWVFDAWQRSAGNLLDVDGASPGEGLFARATRAGTQVHVLLASFVATGGADRTIQLVLKGCVDPSGGELRSLDQTSKEMTAATPVAVEREAFDVSLPAQSVRWVTVHCH